MVPKAVPLYPKSTGSPPIQQPILQHHDMVPYSAKRWRRKTLANQQNIALAKKTLANHQLGRSSRNLGRLMQAARNSKTLANRRRGANRGANYSHLHSCCNIEKLNQNYLYSAIIATPPSVAGTVHVQITPWPLVKLPRECAVYSSVNV